ncbi:MAG TPA: UbiA family prenyltransferase [Candidatus Limnocylindrales bacterium]|nr:UbiA family prenyltransferase [Candidatus Limnocylindrales bacterium]
MGALARLVHPFPSILDGLVVAGVALLAEGALTTALRLGLSMTLLQFAIGVVNDIVDAPADARHVPPKPIPAGMIERREAAVVAATAALIGLALAAPSGPALVALALAVLGIGLVYDLAAKGTPWSWVPFAIGIPILPIYGWFGATGALPPFFAVLILMAVLAGAGLAIANARADLGLDTEAGTTSVATMLGTDRSWWAEAALMVAAIAVGIVSLGGSGFDPVPWALVSAGIGIVVAGLVLGRRSERRARLRAWEAQAVGAAIAAIGWIAGISAQSF